MFHKIKVDDVIGHVIGQPYCFFFKPSKIFFTEMAEQIEAKLYKYDRLSTRNKTFTNMISLVTWFGSHIGFTRKPTKKIHHSKEVLARV